MYQLAHINSKLIGYGAQYEEETHKVRKERNDQTNSVIELLRLVENVFVQHIFKFHQGVTSIWILKWK